MSTNTELGLTSVYPVAGRVVIALETPSGTLRYVNMTRARALRLAAQLLEVVASLDD